MITCDRESRGGGVGFLVSDELSVEIIQKTTKRHQQILTVEIETSENKCLVTVLYKAPNYSIDNFTDDLIEHFENTKSDVDSRILWGEFNTDIRKLNKNSTKLIEFLKLFDYHLKNSYDCTRENVNSQSAIELFFANHNCKFYVEKTKISDHYSIFLELDIATKNNVPPVQS